MKQIEIPTIKPALKRLILEALGVGYSSAGKDNIATGNHYQSLTLGDERTAGFRTDRNPFLDQIDFRGKRVLDLGSNLGEISRAARARGAALVDGYEYDPFFVEMAQVLDAYNGTTGVSFFQRDITDPEIYVDHYDLVLAFSVFTYIHPVLERLAGITDEALVVETHKLDGNLDKGYLGPVVSADIQGPRRVRLGTRSARERAPRSRRLRARRSMSCPIARSRIPQLALQHQRAAHNTAKGLFRQRQIPRRGGVAGRGQILGDRPRPSRS